MRHDEQACPSQKKKSQSSVGFCVYTVKNKAGIHHAKIKKKTDKNQKNITLHKKYSLK